MPDPQASASTRCLVGCLSCRHLLNSRESRLNQWYRCSGLDQKRKPNSDSMWHSWYGLAFNSGGEDTMAMDTRYLIDSPSFRLIPQILRRVASLLDTDFC